MFRLNQVVITGLIILLSTVLFTVAVSANSDKQMKLFSRTGGQNPAITGIYKYSTNVTDVDNKIASTYRGQYYNTNQANDGDYTPDARQHRDVGILHVRRCKTVDEVIAAYRKSDRLLKVVGIRRVKGGYRVTLQYPDGRVRVQRVSC